MGDFSLVPQHPKDLGVLDLEFRFIRQVERETECHLVLPHNNQASDVSIELDGRARTDACVLVLHGNPATEKLSAVQLSSPSDAPEKHKTRVTIEALRHGLSNLDKEQDWPVLEWCVLACFSLRATRVSYF